MRGICVAVCVIASEEYDRSFDVQRDLDNFVLNKTEAALGEKSVAI